MRIAFIVPRYGVEILGGPEHQCRLVAEKMGGRHQVEVLTTCARDQATWKNEYPEGTDRIRGVAVRRFANARLRDPGSFGRSTERILEGEPSSQEELEWLKEQGPWCPALFEHLERRHRAYDALIFFGCFNAPTVLGVRISPQRSILVPSVLDDRRLDLRIIREVFAVPAGIAYVTDIERDYVTARFRTRAVASDTVGCGVELPQHHRYPHARFVPKREMAGEAESDGTPTGGEQRPSRSWQTERGAVFRRRHRLHGQFVLFGGRIERGKGCEELTEYFGRYVRDQGHGSLVLMGAKLMTLPEETFINFAGMLPERERLQALEAATVVAVPSPRETLSLLALEAFAVGTPILANARSEVLVSHCTRSNAGLYYADGDEFLECLKLLMEDERLRASMGRNGRDYIRQNYRWDVVLSKYERMIAALARR